MLGMRLTQGVDTGLFEHARSVLGGAAVDAALTQCAQRGLVSFEGGRWRPTNEGWLLGNELYGSLWGLATGEVIELSC